MNTSVFDIAHRRSPISIAPASLLRSSLLRSSLLRSLLLRSSLIAVVLIAVGVAAYAAAHVGAPSTLLHDDPELAQLLRGMALIKGSIVVAAAAAVWWRFGRPIPRVAATTYLAAVSLMAGATVSIWQLSSLLPAAVVFHVGLFASLLVALRSDEVGRSLTRR